MKIKWFLKTFSDFKFWWEVTTKNKETENSARLLSVLPQARLPRGRESPQGAEWAEDALFYL